MRSRMASATVGSPIASYQLTTGNWEVTIAVGSLSGHKDGSNAFARYREIDDEMKKELVDLLK